MSNLKLKLSPEDIQLLELTQNDLDIISLVPVLQTDDIASCRKTNGILIEAYRIIGDKLAVLEGLKSEHKHTIAARKARALGLLTGKKLTEKAKDAAMKFNNKAKQEWIKAGNKEDTFVPPKKYPTIPDVTGIAPDGEYELTDSAIKALADAYSVAEISEDYAQINRLSATLTSIKETISKIADRVQSTIIAFGTEGKLYRGE